ncbi:MAG: DUF169 domain-containing protein [Methanoregula sp.]
MKSIVAEKLKLKYEPTAILWSNTKPEGALQIKPHAYACVMMFFAQVAVKGKTAVFDRESYGCPGARAGLGFGNGFEGAFGGEGTDFVCAFLTKGAESSKNPEAYRQMVQHVPERERPKFLYGERIYRNVERATKHIENFPITDIPEKYVIFTPLSKVKPGEHPVAVVFLVDPLQVTGLATLIGSFYEGLDAVYLPPVSGCEQIGAMVYEEAKREHPRAVLGFTDPTARENVGKTIPRNMFTFAVPYKLFEEMEEATYDGLFESPTWKALTGDQEGTAG